MNDYVHTANTPDNNYRVTVTHDFHAEKPWSWLDNVGIYTVRHARELKVIEHDLNGNNSELLEIQTNSANDELFDLAIERHFKRAGLHFKRVALQGYSQSEWADTIVYAEEEYDVTDLANTLKQWFRGDVYTLTVEKSVTYVNRDNPEDLIEQWQYVDSVSGYYLDYLDNFSDDEELLALVDDLIPDNN